MKKRYSFILIPFICLLIWLFSCQREDQPLLNAPEDEEIYYITFGLQIIDSVRYWGDSEKIRLKSGSIMLRPDNHTYIKTFIGTADEALDPAQVNWSKEETGKYIFSADSSFILFSNDDDPVVYFPGYWKGGIYHDMRLEQYDSAWYSISYYSMGVSGKFIYSQTPLSPLSPPSPPQ